MIPPKKPAQGELFLRHASIVALAADPEWGGRGGAVFHSHSPPPHTVALPPLRAGRLFLEHWRVHQVPAFAAWDAPSYAAFAPPVFQLRDPLLHSSAGILAVADRVLSETLAHTTEEKNQYRLTSSGIALPKGRIRPLPGTHISLLAGAAENHFHALIEGPARLAAVPPELLACADGVLIPDSSGAGAAALEMLGLPERLAVRRVRDDETLRVEHLILPMSVHGDTSFHPVVRDFFATLAAAAPPGSRGRRLYIDRRGNPLRPLVNEEEVIAALAPLGFEPVQPERLAFAEQIALFRDAAAIVGPHGAALTGLGVCAPGTPVVELLMDAYTNWVFRHLCALQKLRYDCVLGRAEGAWPDRADLVHLARWRVSVPHVAAAVAQAVAE